MLSLSLVSWFLFSLCYLFYFFLIFIIMNILYFSFFLINNSFLITYKKKKKKYYVFCYSWHCPRLCTKKCICNLQNYHKIVINPENMQNTWLSFFKEEKHYTSKKHYVQQLFKLKLTNTSSNFHYILLVIVMK